MLYGWFHFIGLRIFTSISLNIMIVLPETMDGLERGPDCFSGYDDGLERGPDCFPGLKGNLT